MERAPAARVGPDGADLVVEVAVEVDWMKLACEHIQSPNFRLKYCRQGAGRYMGEILGVKRDQ